MNKNYMEPEMNVTLFERVDVIMNSNPNGFEGEEDTNLPNLTQLS